MSRRLKRKIRDICNLDHLSKEERRLAATSILNDTNAKQKLCNSMPGLSFKDIERAMRDILAERQPTEAEIEEEELMEIAPEKFEPPTLLGRKSTPGKMKYRVLTPEETRVLIEASKAPFEPPPVSENSTKLYNTYTMEQAVALINGTYDPNDPNLQRKDVLRRKR